MTDKLNLYQKLVQLRKHVSDLGLNKDKKSYGNIEYVTGNQILTKISDKMAELNLLLIPATKLGEYTEKGKDFIVKGEMKYTWINADNPEEQLECEWAYYGQQNEISKAYGSGLTYSERYFLLKFLGVSTDTEDPDFYDNSRRQAKTNSYKNVGKNNQQAPQQNSLCSIKSTYTNCET